MAATAAASVLNVKSAQLLFVPVKRNSYDLPVTEESCCGTDLA